jgi:hypothetical protein
VSPKPVVKTSDENAFDDDFAVEEPLRTTATRKVVLPVSEMAPPGFQGCKSHKGRNVEGRRRRDCGNGRIRISGSDRSFGR